LVCSPITLGYLPILVNHFGEGIDEVERHFRNLDNFLYTAASSELEQLRGIHEILEEANE
jgi:hypothetical protein